MWEDKVEDVHLVIDRATHVLQDWKVARRNPESQQGAYTRGVMEEAQAGWLKCNVDRAFFRKLKTMS